SGTRGGVINLNSAQVPALAAVLRNTITREDTPRVNTGNGSPSPAPMLSPVPTNVITSLLLAGRWASPTAAPMRNPADLANLIARASPSPSPTLLDPSIPKTQRESIVRALSEVDQTRTWNLLIDVVAQTGRFAPNTTSLANGFVVNGEQRYWIHVAID